MYAVVLNSDHPLVKRIIEDADKTTAESLNPIVSELKGLHARLSALRQQQNNKKAEEVTQAEKDSVKECENSIKDEEEKRNKILSDYGKDNAIVHQLIDLALLQNGLLKGEALNKFLKRSISLIK